MSSDDTRLSDCGCCEGAAPETPVPAGTPPGQARLARRVGTHARFKASMLAGLGTKPALAGLTARDDGDPSIAIADAFAAALDVLTFYSERIANEGYLRTAAERRSVLELARAIGYELSPGVAASTWLAFTCETTPGAPESTSIPAGTRAQSIPGQDELPQVFETSEEIEARPAWNELRPQLTARTAPRPGSTGLALEGTATGLRRGDGVLFVHAVASGFPSAWEFRRIVTVTPDGAANRTHVTWSPALGAQASSATTLHAFRTRASIFGHNSIAVGLLVEAASEWLELADGMVELAAQPILEAMAPGGVEAAPVVAEKASRKALASAPASMMAAVWADQYFVAGTTVINLDTVYPEIVAPGWVVLSSPSRTGLFRVDAVSEESLVVENVSAKTTRLELFGSGIASFKPRDTTVFAVADPLAVAEAPEPEPMPRNVVVLEGRVQGLTVGQRVAVSGSCHPGGEPAAEIRALAGVAEVAGRTQLEFEGDLAHDYRRASVRINANVAPATHGESWKEVLGSGDASRPLQHFTLRQSPLTHVRAANASGGRSTLAVRVNGVLWDEAPSFFESGSADVHYVVRIDDGGKANLVFGDGRRGARLPTGVENVEASYRAGTGLAGMVRARQVSLLMTRPLGVREVVNPTAPEGGDDPETLDAARRNAPLTVLTLDRIVSLADYESFARGFSGIAKARGDFAWDGARRVVHLTLAGPEGAAVEPASETAKALRTAIDDARHALVPVVLASRTLLPFRVGARLKADPRRERPAVEAAVTAALLEAFSFEAMEFARPLAASRVLAVIQSVPGVIAADLDTFALAGATAGPEPEDVLPARAARPQEGGIAAAEILVIDPAGIDVRETLA